MNPLFRNFERAIKEAALREFRATQIGKLAGEARRLSRGSGSRRRATQLVREIGRAAGRVEKYSLTDEIGRWVSKAVREFLKPIAALLRGLGGGGGSRRPPRGPVSPASEERPENPFDAEIQTAVKFLEAFGYTVTPPGQSPQRPTRREEPEHDPQRWGFQTEPPRQPGQTGQVMVGGRARNGDPNDPVFSGEMVEVQSSNVHSIGFLWNDTNPMQGTLKVRFLQNSRKGKGRIAGPLYYYYNVNPGVFDAFLRAGSPGGFVWDRLRIRGTVSGHRFHYELRGISEGYLPRKATRYGNNEYFTGRRAQFQNVRTGQTQEFESQLPDQFVQTLNPPRRGPQGFVPPDRGSPDRGGPNRGRPNRGRP